jgi:mRNA interferase MazF
MAITSQQQRAGYPLTWRVPPGMLDREAWVKIAQVRTLATQRLGKRIGQLPAEALREIVDGLSELIG